jgi:hypothetical protein
VDAPEFPGLLADVVAVMADDSATVVLPRRIVVVRVMVQSVRLPLA